MRMGKGIRDQRQPDMGLMPSSWYSFCISALSFWGLPSCRRCSSWILGWRREERIMLFLLLAMKGVMMRLTARAKKVSARP